MQRLRVELHGLCDFLNTEGFGDAAQGNRKLLRINCRSASHDVRRSAARQLLRGPDNLFIPTLERIPIKKRSESVHQNIEMYNEKLIKSLCYK
jgi:hypothetical protein